MLENFRKNKEGYLIKFLLFFLPKDKNLKPNLYLPFKKL